MKKVIAIFLTVSLLLNISVPAFAGSGSGNIDGGGGSMGDGTDYNYWNSGDDGVRVTVIRSLDNVPVSTPFDLTNCAENNMAVSFVKKCKLQYKYGASLEVNLGTYTYINPSQNLPTIITDSGNGNISAIRSYFTDRLVVQYIASITGIPYDTLTSGKYKLLLEPVGYFTFNGCKMAMTATEAAMYDEILSGGLRSKMKSFSHQNLPLSMFLQYADMGYPAYHGPTNRPQPDAAIINQLGLGIVKFKDNGTTPPPSSSTATYRCDTDVITSVTLTSYDEISPNSPASVTFHISGGSYTVTNIVVPEGESQLVWVKWHTPSTPQAVNISVSASKGFLDIGSIKANIVSVDGHEPPDPTADDRNDSFTAPSVPSPSVSSVNAWGVWSGTWVPDWVWDEDWVWIPDSSSKYGGCWTDNGSWEDRGQWKYTYTVYRATLSADMDLMPDTKDPSARGKHMKSGYGVDIDVSGDISSNAPQSHVTAPQTALSYFPEFQYQTYWRQLDCTLSGTSAALVFKKNIYSTYNDRVHFTPLWYPDGTYTVYTYLEDAWTPAGMLSANLTDSVQIKGNVYDDWHIGPRLIG